MFNFDERDLHIMQDKERAEEDGKDFSGLKVFIFENKVIFTNPNP